VPTFRKSKQSELPKKQMQLIAYLIRKSLKQFHTQWCFHKADKWQMQWKIELKIETPLL